MLVLFTTGKNPISWLIRKVTGDDCSHCVLQIGDIVLHSDFLGVRVEPISFFSRRVKILHSVEVPSVGIPLEKILAKHTGRWYDIPGFIYLGLRLLFPFLPKNNLWQTTGMYLCTELVTSVLDEKEHSTITPHKLYIVLKDRYDKG